MKINDDEAVRACIEFKNYYQITVGPKKREKKPTQNKKREGSLGVRLPWDKFMENRIYTYSLTSCLKYSKGQKSQIPPFFRPSYFWD